MEDRYIEDTREPPEEPEAQFCDECGDELEQIDVTMGGLKYITTTRSCDNPFCPSKFEGVEREMAIALVEYMDKCWSLQEKIKHLEMRIKLFENS